jgi:hypothetical protein
LTVILDVQEERVKFRNIQKIGLAVVEMKKVATIQQGILFFIPYIIAMIHTIFALKTLQNMMGASIVLYTVIILILLFIVQIMYFILLRFKYIRALLKPEK